MMIQKLQYLWIGHILPSGGVPLGECATNGATLSSLHNEQPKGEILKCES